MNALVVVPLVVVTVLSLALISMRRLASEGTIRCDTLSSDRSGSELVVMVHGLSGRTNFEPAVKLARSCFPEADLLVLEYDASLLSNLSPYRITNTLEHAIHDAWATGRHRRIVLVGHSLGGLIARKALLWGHGFEEDRGAFGCKGKRAWVDHVERLVSLAGINRGWSISPKPEKMTASKCAQIWLGERLGRFSDAGRLLLSLRRGSPFVADARVQWIRLVRGRDAPTRRLPQTVHLLGDQDDIVSREDSLDLAAAKGTLFVTLPNTGHAQIAQALDPRAPGEAAARAESIRHALLGEFDRLDVDKVTGLTEDHRVGRVIYLMHGIRDYGGWTDIVRDAIEREPAPDGERIEVVNKKYGYFPMLPFLLYADRQRNVRKFMDEYTENLARFPKATTFDFVGHSNGTYILASALQHYRTLNVGRVFFAGSVVPKHYPWRKLADEGRVERVVNVVAASDWVVALFPKLFEQIADWARREPVTGPLDIGSGGFRGFQDAQDANDRVDNLLFCEGSHGAGVAVTQPRKLQAIVDYAVRGDETGFDVFRGVAAPNAALDALSNISWLVWGLLVATVVGFGWLVALLGWVWLAAYAIILVLLLNSL